MRRRRSRLLAGWGLESVAASSAEALLEALSGAARRPDTLVVDLHLAHGASGLDAITRVREALAAALPALVITADRSAEAQSQVLAAGHVLLHKPVEPARLRAALAHLVA